MITLCIIHTPALLYRYRIQRILTKLMFLS